VYPTIVARQRLGKTLPIVARQRLDKHVLAKTNTRSNKMSVGRVCLWVCLCNPIPLQGNSLVKTFPRQGRIVGGVVFYAVHIVLKESRQLVLPKLLDFYCNGIFLRNLYFHFMVGGGGSAEHGLETSASQCPVRF
jgi:hypothetical protein